MVTAAIPLLFAHRGCSTIAPENTLSAFRAAVDLGIEGIELDVRLARSGEVIISHDRRLKRTAGIDASVDTLDWSELRTIDVGSWFHRRFAAERIPLLEDVFETFGDTVFYDIEIKLDRGDDPGIAGAVAKLIAASGLVDRCIVSSFNPIAIRRFSRSGSSVPTGLIYSGHTSIPRALRRGGGCLVCRCSFVKPNWKQISEPTVRRHKKRKNRRVIAWTVDEEDIARSLFSFGVDAIISNEPQKLKEAAKTAASTRGERGE